MSTLPIHATDLNQGWSFPSFARFVAALRMIADAYSEALQQTHDARRKYPFAGE